MFTILAFLLANVLIVGVSIVCLNASQDSKVALAKNLFHFMIWVGAFVFVFLAMLLLLQIVDLETFERTLASLLWVLVYDGFLLMAAAGILVPLAVLRQAAFAVLLRNFVGYFSNPTGYVFLCLFVLLTSIAAFCPHEFFNRNLANLDQLNIYLPYIMLVFIPAITMSIWSEEQAQGTDELLLTMPASDFDIVSGKYLAAVLVFSASLVFSQLSNFSVLTTLAEGDIDIGLFFSTYLGYWFMGLVMLAIGMIASFLARNLTVSFILGLLFNAPLVFAIQAETLVPTNIAARMIKGWSLGAQLDNFGRGILSASSIVYFLMLTAVGLYLSMVLIGRRHWVGGKHGSSLWGHFFARAVLLIVIAFGANLLFRYNDFREDVTTNQITELSAETKELVREIDPQHPVYIDAFLSGDVPEDYVRTRADLISTLKEFESLAGSNIVVRINENVSPLSEAAAQAEERFGIRPENVQVVSRGRPTTEEIVLAAAFTCGLERVVVPFFDYGTPVEYELARSIATVAQTERKKLGVLMTDARVTGGMDMASMQNMEPLAIVDELEKQFDIVEVNPAEEIDTDKFDVLLAAQPSSLNEQGMKNFVDAVRKGVPTAIFEDPVPGRMSWVVGTSQPKRPMGGMFGGGRPPEPKGDINQLWDTLGMEMVGDNQFGQFQADVIWQNYIPYEKLVDIRPELVFVRPEQPGGADAFNDENPITAGLEEVLFFVPGAIKKKTGAETKFDALVRTGEQAGTVSSDVIFRVSDPMQLSRERGVGGQQYVLAAAISENADEELDDEENPSDEAASDDEDAEDAEESDAKEDSGLNVVYIADVDMLSDVFMFLRARPGDSGEMIQFRFENVTFVLNVLDYLVGEPINKAYIDIRKRKPHYGTLHLVENEAKQARQRRMEAREEIRQEREEALKKARKEMEESDGELQTKFEELQKKQSEGEGIDLSELAAAQSRLNLQQSASQQRFSVMEKRINREEERKMNAINREEDQEIQRIRNTFKAYAVALPPIPPLFLGLLVFVRRKLRERETVSRTRRK